MRVLLVGAGAVGQVFGLALQRGGAEIAFLVKPAHLEATRQGLWVRRLNRGRHAAPERLEAPVYTAPPPGQRWDQIWLCVASPALRGQWLDEVVAALGAGALVALQPGLDDRELLLSKVPEAQLVSGMISFMAWAEPLPGEAPDPPCVRTWTPPLSPCPFDGPRAPVREIVATLRRGGQPATATRAVVSTAALGTAVLLPTMAALECAGWRFAAWRAGETIGLGVAASREALAIAAAYHRRAAPPGWMLRAWMLALVSRLAPAVVPTDVEAFFKLHFSKVSTQTDAALADWIRWGEANGHATRALRALEAARAGRGPSAGPMNAL